MTKALATASKDQAIQAAIKPRRFGAWYIAEHHFRLMRRYFGTMLAYSLGGPMLYLYGMGIGLAIVVDNSVGQGGVNGVSYLWFIAPALLANSAITAATEEMSFTVYGGFKWNPIYLAMYASPISPAQIVIGKTFAVAVRILVTVALYFGFLLLFNGVGSSWGWLMIFPSTMVGLSLGLMFMAFVSGLENDTGQITMIMRFVVTPMFLFSGTFYPLEQLPIYLHWIGWISPLWHGSELGRVLSFGYPEQLWLSLIHIGYLLLLSVIGLIVSIRRFSARLSK